MDQFPVPQALISATPSLPRCFLHFLASCIPILVSSSCFVPLQGEAACRGSNKKEDLRQGSCWLLLSSCKSSPRQIESYIVEEKGFTCFCSQLPPVLGRATHCKTGKERVMIQKSNIYWWGDLQPASLPLPLLSTITLYVTVSAILRPDPTSTKIN